MTKKIVKMIKRLFAVFLTMLLISSETGTVLAESYSLDSEVSLNDLLAERENAVSSAGGSYSYTAPDEGEFIIETVTGTISITNDTPEIQFGSHVVSIPDFDYYKIVDENGVLRFYQADVLANPEQSSEFVCISVYKENLVDILHIQYMIESENKLYNIMISLTGEQFLYFSEISTELCLGTDDVSNRLKLSGRMYKKGSFESSGLDNVVANEYIGNGSVSTMALIPIADYTYDSYTNEDGIIHSYMDDHFGNHYLDDGFTIIDDPIVEIIPKELFFILGEHIYVGKEYGFFLRVVQDNLDLRHYAADVIVFDIDHTLPSLSEPTGAVKVSPVFRCTYRAAPAGTMIDMDPTLSSVVIPHVLYDYIELFLYEVGFKISVDNAVALNQSDSGYDKNSDNGAFIVQTRLNVRGVGLKKKNASFVQDTALFMLGFGKVTGPITVIGAYIDDLNNGFGNGGYKFDRAVEIYNNEANIHTNAANRVDQIALYGDLIKAESVKMVSDAESPRLIHVGGGYAEVKYLVSSTAGFNNCKTRTIVSVSVQVVEDNTALIFGRETGEKIEFDRGTGTYEVGDYKRLDDITLNGYATTIIPANSQTNIIKVTPKVSGSYKLITSSSNGDPQFRITNATKGTSTVVATDDINGSSNRNATLILELIGGDIYYIEAIRYVPVYEEPHEYTLRMGYNPATTQGMSAGTSYSVTTTKDSYQMIKVTPTSSGSYRIRTNKTSGDPQIFLFSSAGVLLGSDDDSGGSLNALLQYTMYAGTTYYIAVQGYNGNATSLTLTVGY